MSTQPSALLDPAPDSRSWRTFWLILATALIADALDLMDSTLTNIAAPTIVAQLGGGQLLIKWLGSAYSLAMGVLLVVGGRLGDKLGHRRIFLVGIAGFTLASALCGVAPSPAVIVIGRLLQGAFGALLIPQGIAIMTSTFPREMLSKAFSAFGPILGVASVAGPLLGAFIVGANLAGLSWRPMFLINIVLGTVGFALAWKVLPRVPGEKAVVLDGLGSGLLAAAMFCLVFGLIDGPTNGWSATAVVLVVAGVLFLGMFALRQRFARNPLIKPSLLRNRGFTTGLVMALAFFSVVSGLAYVFSLFLQQGMGRSPVQTALGGIAPMAIGLIAASFLAAPLMQRFGRYLVLAGLVITLIGVLALWVIVAREGIAIGAWPLAATVFVVGMGMGTCFGTLFDIALGDIDPAEAGSASGSLSAVQQLAGSIGSAIITSIWFGHLASDAPSAVIACLKVVAVVTVGCCALVWLLPRKAQARDAEA